MFYRSFIDSKSLYSSNISSLILLLVMVIFSPFELYKAKSTEHMMDLSLELCFLHDHVCLSQSCHTCGVANQTHFTAWCDVIGSV
jgi:hypothetical protein